MELLDLRYDAVFKEFFKDKELLSSFISSIIGKNLEVKSLEYTEEKSVDDGRSIIFDILAVDKDGNKINIEMEKNSTTSIKKRTQFYWAKAFTRGFEKKSKFKDLKKTICINILGKNVFKDDVVSREYVLYDVENKDRLDDCLSIYFVELPKGESLKGESVKDLWIKLLSNSKKVDAIPKDISIIKKAVSKVYELSEINDIQIQVIKEALEESKILDWKDDILELADNMVKEAQDMLKNAEDKAKEAQDKAKEAEDKLKEAENKAKETEDKLKEAENKAKETEDKLKEAENKAKEAEDKLKEIEKQAQKNEQIKMAKNMLQNNIDINIISNLTGLEISEINKIVLGM